MNNTKKTKKFVSIQRKLVSKNAQSMVLLNVVVAILIFWTATVLTQDTLRLTMKQLANGAAHNLNNQIYTYTLCMNGISDSPYFSDTEKYRDQIVERLQNKADIYWAFTSFIDLDGNDYMTGENHSGKEFFTRPLSDSNTFVSSPQYKDGGYYFTFSVAAVYEGDVVGVFYMVSDYAYFASLLDVGTVGETGKTYVITTNDAVIIDDDIGSGMQVGATKHLNKNESHLALEAKAKLGETGFSNYWGENGNRVAGYTAVNGTDGWILITTADSNEFMSSFSFVMTVGLLITFASIWLVVFSNIRNTRKFIIPMTQCVERISSLATGDVYSPVPDINTNDEAGLLAQSTETLTESIERVLVDQKIMLGAIANGDFTVVSQHPEAYAGDFAPLLESFNQIIERLNVTLVEIAQSSVEVNSAANVVSMSATNLAEGTVQQEASARALVGAFTTITEEVEKSTMRANIISEGIHRTGDEVQLGKRQLDELVDAMEEISSSARKIEDIIKGIEDIAFQTNILSLNASVEAARAGTSGRGFAVVADEVRNLSIRSTKHVEATSGLVDATIQAIEAGRKIVHDTAENMNNIVEEVESAVEGTREISEAMARQSIAVETIGRSLDDISHVIENTTATSQESASTSEELSAFADSLHTMISEFKLNDNDGAN